MCMTVKRPLSSTRPQKGCWGYKVVEVSDGKFKSRYRGYLFHRGWHAVKPVRGATRESIERRLKTMRKRVGVFATVRISEGVFHCFQHLSDAIANARFGGCRPLRVIRVWIPEYAHVCRGTFSGTKNIGASVCYFPETGGVYNEARQRWE